MSIYLHWQRHDGHFWDAGIPFLEALVMKSEDSVSPNEQPTHSEVLASLGEISEWKLQDHLTCAWFWHKAHDRLDRLALDQETTSKLVTEMAHTVPYTGRC
ncbi:MAG: hypothetical protein NW237_09215 [Cyanobacteriota bacterium]|nr:hypothetical protein [Cyanobacteriota bacterium]